MTEHSLHLFSKSHAEKTWECPREEYWAYVWGLLGLRRTATQFDLEFGRIIHEAAAETVRQLDPLAFPAAVLRLDAVQVLGSSLQWNTATINQWSSIAEGLVRAFGTRILPTILREFEIVDVEVPMVYPIDAKKGIWFVCKPDLILKHRVDGSLWYWEHKTTGSVDAKWINSWNRAVQVHSGIKAAERKYQQPFAGCIVFGWYKGRKDYYSDPPIQISPFAYGWIKPGAPGVVEDQTAYERPKYYKGWERFSTSDLAGGLAPWVEKMPNEILLKQFVRTPPITIREDLVADFFDQIRHRADLILEARTVLARAASVEEIRSTLNRYFPQNFNQCEPPYGNRKCWALELCWESWVQADPVGSGLFVRNTGEHLQEYEDLIRAEL